MPIPSLTRHVKTAIAGEGGDGRFKFRDAVGLSSAELLGRQIVIRAGKRGD
jgi:hypothetical protein